MRALTNENQFSKASVFDLGINYFLNYNVNPYIFFNLNPMAKLQSGHIQSIDANEKLENRLSILNAAVYFSWMPVSHYAIGIMNSSDIYSPVLVAEKGFFSTQLKQSLIAKAWTFSAQAQASIPNSESSVTDQNEKESTPLLSSAGISSDWKINEKTFALVSINYFKYSQIPTSVSTQSIESGNTSSDYKISDTERTFKYAYEGLDSSLSFSRYLGKSLYIIGNGGIVYNQSAPQGYNQGMLAGAGLGLNISNNQELEFSGNYYKIEPDAVLAHYANSRFFRTNHQGYELNSSLTLKKEKFKISFSFNDSKLIYENPSQSDEKLYFLKFEVFNVAI